MHNIIYETGRQSRFDARYWMLGAGSLGRPRGIVRGGRREEGSGWGTRIYLWWIHVDIWQNPYNIVKLKNKIIKKEKNKRQQDMTLKDELLRLIGALSTTGEEQKNSSIRNEEAELKQRQCPVVDVSDGESKV